MQKFEKITKIITGAISSISYVGFFFIMMLTVVDVIIRYITGNSILGVYEIVERVMICAVFAAFAYTQTEHGHVMISLIIRLFPIKLKCVMLALNNLLSAAASVLVGYAAGRQAIVAYHAHSTTGVLKIIIYPFYWVVVVSMAALAIAFLLDTARNIAAIGNKELADKIDSEFT